MVVARWVTDGESSCTISPAYNSIMNRTDGRLGQVVEDFSRSETQSKADASAENEGLLWVAIVDNCREGDKQINDLLFDIDSDIEVAI